MKRKGKVVGQGGGEEARGGGVRGVVVGAGRNRAAVDVEGDAQRRSLGKWTSSDVFPFEAVRFDLPGNHNGSTR